jgi:predicted metalloendopeptidase
MLQIKAKENFKTLREPIDRKAWGPSPPTVVNAFYTPSKNQISKSCFVLYIIFSFGFSFSSWNSSNAFF